MHPDGTVRVPIGMFRDARWEMAVKSGYDKNILFVVSKGIGDQICAEPTIRFAFDLFKDRNITVATDYPEFFSHLPIQTEDVSDSAYIIHTMPDDVITKQTINIGTTHCIDYPALAALRIQLPVEYKSVMLIPKYPELDRYFDLFGPWNVIVHCGRHWDTKTYSSEWWNSLLFSLRKGGFIPVLIGRNMGKAGYVDVDSTGCIDLRDKTTVNDCLHILQNAKYVITNDSAPLHMAVTGDAFIAFLSTAKHPDYITHYRHGKWKWRMKNFEKRTNFFIIGDEKFTQEEIDSWLPDPGHIVTWLIGCKNGYEP